MGKVLCTKCQKEKPDKEFYTFKNKTKDDICKNCITRNINNDDPDTFLWILQRYDVPYVEKEWRRYTTDAKIKNPAKYGSASVLGKYLRKYKLPQYDNLHYEDTERLAKEEEEVQKRIKEAVKEVQEDEQLLEQYEAGLISKAEFDTMQPEEEIPIFEMPQINEDDILRNLTDEEYTYLMKKWGTMYKPSEWITMEDMYLEYANEYELNVDRKQSLIQICKNYLKMNQALDMGDLSGYKSLASVNDQLRKAAKLTDAQNKEEKQDVLSTIGELVELCEREGGIIPQFQNNEDYPEDKIDITIKDLKSYTYDLVTKEQGLGDLIESYIEKLEKKEEEEAQGNLFGNDMFILSQEDEDKQQILSDAAHIDFQNYVESEVERDAEKLEKILAASDKE